MAQVIKLKRSSVAGKSPTTSSLELGEVAINTYDGKIYFEKSGSTHSVETIVTTDSQTTGSIELTGNVVGNLVEVIDVTVVSDGGNKYAFEGATTPDLVLEEGKTYRFDTSDSSCTGHPFRFSLGQNGTHNSYNQYTAGKTEVGTPGSAGSYTQLSVTKATSNYLYYYCGNHSGMGNDGLLIKNDLTNLHIISGSSVSTGSFGHLKVGGGNFTSTSLAGAGSGTGFPFTGSAGLSGSLEIVGNDGTIFNVVGDSGSLFNVTNQLSGSLFSVNDISGLPIIEAFSDNTVKIGSYANPIIVDGSGNISGSSVSTGSFGRVQSTSFNSTTLGGTLTTAAQPNITSLGNLPYIFVGSTTAPYIDVNPTSQTIDGMVIGGTTAASGKFTTVTTSGNVSGSSVSTGSFGLIKGDGSGITGLTSAAISSVAGMTNNYVLTATGGDSVTGESNLTFDGNQLTISPGGSGEISLNGILGTIASTTLSNSGTISSQHITATGNISGSLVSTGSFGHFMVGGGNFTSASLASGGGGSGTGFPFTGSAGLSGSLAIEGQTGTIFSVVGDSGSLFTVTNKLSGSIFSANLVSGLPVIEAFSDNIVKIGAHADPIIISGSGMISGSSVSTGSFGHLKVGGGNFTSTSLAGAGSGTGFPFTGSAGLSGSLAIEGQTGTIFSVVGDSGSLFTVTNQLSGSIFSANLVSGLPVIEAFSDNIVKIGPYSSPIIIDGSGNISGSLVSTGSFGHYANISASVAAAGFGSGGGGGSDDMSWNTGIATRISGSATSTGSFGRVQATKIGGTLTTAAQTNITSLGNLSALTVGVPTAPYINIGGTAGSTIDNVTIGGNTAAAGTFTTVTTTGNISGSVASTGSFGHIMVGGGNFTSASLASSGGGGSSAADDITAGDAAVTLTTTVGNITIDAQGNDTDIIFKGTDGTVDTEFMRIDGSTSKIGIGTATPEAMLHIEGSSNPQLLIKESSTDFVRIGMEGTNNHMCLGWDDSDDMLFGGFSSTTDTSISEYMRIEAPSGYVGIGTTSPDELLDVDGNIYASGNISGSATSTGSFGHIMVGGGNFTSASLASSGGGGGGVSFPYTGDISASGDLYIDGVAKGLRIAPRTGSDSTGFGAKSGYLSDTNINDKWQNSLSSKEYVDRRTFKNAEVYTGELKTLVRYPSSGYDSAYKGDDLWSDGTFLFYAAGDDGLFCFLINQDGTITKTDGDDPGYTTNSVWGDGRFVYTCNNAGDLFVHTISEAGIITRLGASWDGSASAEHVRGDGNFIYVASSHDGVHSFSVSDAGAITLKDTLDNNTGNDVGLHCDGNYIYVADSAGGVLVLKVDDEGSLSLVDSDDRNSGDVLAVWKNDDYLFAAADGSGIYVYKVSTAGQLTYVSTYDEDGYRAFDVWGDENYIYAAAYTYGTYVLSCDSAGTLTKVYVHPATYRGYHISGDKNYIYRCEGSYGIEVLERVKAYGYDALLTTPHQYSGSVNITGSLTVDSSISGSSISTGSFGHLKVGGGNFTSASLASSGGGGSDDMSWNDGTATRISGSVASTGSFALIDGKLRTSTQPNITSLGNLPYIFVGSTTGPYIDVNPTSQTIDGMVIGGTTAAAGTFTTVTTSGNVSGSSVSTGSFGRVEATTFNSTTLGGTLTTAAQPNITSIGALSNLTVGQGSITYIDIGGTAGSTIDDVTIGGNIAASGKFTTVTTSGNVSGSSVSTGSFGRVEATTFVGDGAGLTGLSSAAISSYTNASNNRVITSVNGSTVNAESNLTFDGTILNTTKLGINTSAVPHGAVGYAKLAIEGTDNHADGPHMQFTTAIDNYPVAQWLNWSHDNSMIGFDVYYDGSAFKSSDAGSNFNIYKMSDKLAINVDSGISPGSAVSMEEAFSIDTSKKVTLGGHISGSSTSTGSFGHIMVGGGNFTSASLASSGGGGGGSTFPFTGSAGLSGSLAIEGQTGTIFSVVGDSGSLFNVTNQLSGSLFSVNDISGLPIIEAFSDNIVKIGPYTSPIIVDGSGNISGSITSTGSFGHYANISASVAAAGFGSGGGGGSSAADDITAGDAAVTLTTTVGNITIDAQGEDTDIIFKGMDGTVATEFMRIDGSTSKIGIGTATPEAVLHIEGSSNPQLLIKESADTFVRVGMEGTNNHMCLGWDDSDDMLFGGFSSTTDTSISEYMRIEAPSGYVGIGTTSPDELLDVDGNIYASGNVSGSSTSTGSFGHIMVGGGNFTSASLAAGGGGGSGGGAQKAFETISVSGQSDVVADSATDTLTLVAGSNMTLTTSAGGDSVTFASSGGGGGGSGTNSGSYMFTQAGDSTSWAITHSLGTKYNAITVYDDSDQVIIPTDITADDTNQTTIGFSSATSGYAVINSGGTTGTVTRVSTDGAHIHTQAGDSTNWAITHSLNSKYPNVTVYGDDDEVMIPTSIKADSVDLATITFSSATSGKAIFSNGGNLSGSLTSTGSFGRVDAQDGFYDGGTKLNVPDYVFEPDYELKSISELEIFVSESKHLPNVPDMDDMKKWKTLSVGDRDMLLLEKIEELSLYVIELNKRLEKVEKNE